MSNYQYILKILYSICTESKANTKECDLCLTLKQYLEIDETNVDEFACELDYKKDIIEL